MVISFIFIVEFLLFIPVCISTSLLFIISCIKICVKK
nr:MAG TPA: hypothetical protein [Caudoviricetes sp.]